MPDRLRLLVLATCRRAQLRAVLGWLLVCAPGVVVAAVASLAFRLMAPELSGGQVGGVGA